VIQKWLLESERGSVVRVRFALPNSIWADRICLVGEFNGWNRDSHPMQRDRDGGWHITLDLPAGRIYQFRYLCDGERWINDTQADGYVTNAFGTDNCVIHTDLPGSASPVEPDTR
jgi:1,4-alpha-glucan branching enzyme